MSQNTSCQYCNNHILAFRSDPPCDLVHHTKKLVLAEQQSQKPQQHECSGADRPTAAVPTGRHLSSDPCSHGNPGAVTICLPQAHESWILKY